MLAAGLAGGCVERKFVIETDPPNALVLVNNAPLGPSPADGSFVYYGKHNFTVMASGYETLHVTENVVSPWYEWFPIDFFFETLWPYEIEDVRRFRYQLVPLQIPNTADVEARARQVREQGRNIRPIPTPPETAGAPPAGEGATAPMPREGER